MTHTHSTTRLKDSLWNDVCQQPTLAANRQHYEKRVSDSTTQLQHCIQNVLTVLNDRVVVLARCANFAAALRDASAMQEISPLSPLGYFHAATIYSEQGRQQAAIDICNEGLNIVDINDPGYIKLQHAKMVAMHRNTYRIDFISKLPFDIVTHVLFPMVLGGDDDDGMLDGRTRCPCLDVSKTWFDRAIEAGGGGLHFKIADQHSYSEVIRLAQYTKSICIEPYHQGDWLSGIFDHANLCFLQKLTIKGLEEYLTATNLDHLVSSLKSAGNTLTHLTITTSTSIKPKYPPPIRRFGGRTVPGPPLHVADIMINCPHLVMLDIAYPYDVSFSSVPLTKTWPKLTTLRLDNHHSDTFNDQSLAMLMRFPSLNKLVLSPYIQTLPMTMIQCYCPSMRELQLKAKCIGSSALERYEQQHEDQWMRGPGGLEKIWFSEDSGNGAAWMDMRNMLQQHHNTLVHIDLDLDYGGNYDDDLSTWNILALKHSLFHVIIRTMLALDGGLSGKHRFLRN